MAILTVEELKKLSAEELQKLAREVEQAMEEKQKEIRKEVIRKIKELAESAGLEVEIRPKRGRKIGPLPIKYRHPEKPELTWKGRGQMPKWLREELAKGRRLEDFRVKETAEESASRS